MSEIQVDAGSASYPIYIENNFAGFSDALAQAGIQDEKICVVADANVSSLYYSEIEQALGDRKLLQFIFTPGEASKNLDTVQDMFRYFVENHLDRRSVVIALGGGVTGDMAGFAAACYMRGIRFVQVPTSLLAQVDSSVGGKVGIDFMERKNMVGAFYQPVFVFINYRTLHTLPPDQFSSGMGEVIKHGLIADASYLSYLYTHTSEIINLEDEALDHIISGSCRIKAQVVSQDEKEQGLRAVLNFGHTFGHALESLSHFALSHGAGVSLGMAAALSLSLLRGAVAKADVDRALMLMKEFQLPVQISGYAEDEILTLMLSDKKTIQDKITLILLNQIGSAGIYRDVPRAEILEGLRSILIPC